MALPDSKSHRISLDEAAAQTKLHRDGQHKGGLFLRPELDQLLAQPGCAGLRYYYGRKAEGEDTLIMIGVDKEGNDMTQGIMLEESFLCPPWCGTANPLNS
jgi:hypothetical protein